MANSTIPISNKIKDVEIGLATCNISPSIATTHISFGKTHSVRPVYVACNSRSPLIQVGAQNMSQTGFDIRAYYTSENTAQVEWMAVWA